MAVFAVILTQENNEVVNRLKELYPTALQLNDEAFLIQSDKITEAVASGLGLRKETLIDEHTTGVVLKLTLNYAGYGNSSIGEWLEQARGKE